MGLPMATKATKISPALERALAARARRDKRTESEILRLALEAYLSPPSEVWAREMLKLNPSGRRLPRRKRPKGVDELTWAIDTTL